MKISDRECASICFPFSLVKQTRLRHWPLSISLILCLFCALSYDTFRRFEAGCKSDDKSPRSSHKMSGSAVTYTGPALRLQSRLAAYTGGRHPYNSIRWLSSSLLWLGGVLYWQSLHLDSDSTEVSAASLSFLRRAYCTEELNPRSSLLFLWDFMNIPRQRDGAANLGGTAKSETMANNTSRLNSTVLKRA